MRKLFLISLLFNLVIFINMTEASDEQISVSQSSTDEEIYPWEGPNDLKNFVKSRDILEPLLTDPSALIQRKDLKLAVRHCPSLIIPLVNKQGLGIDTFDSKGYSLLHYAAKLGQFDSIQVLIKARANLNLQTNDDNQDSALGLTFINYTEPESHLCFELLVKAGANIHLRNSHHETPFAMALELDSAFKEGFYKTFIENHLALQQNNTNNVAGGGASA